MATKLHSNRMEFGSMNTSTRNSLGSVPTGTVAVVTGVGVQVYDGSEWKTVIGF